MVTVSIDEAQKDLRKVIRQANAGENVVITEGGIAVACVSHGAVVSRARS
jgi:prevent-host-death family protein